MNLYRYISTSKPEEKIDLQKVHSELVNIENNILEATNKHNEFLKELGLNQLPLTILLILLINNLLLMVHFGLQI